MSTVIQAGIVKNFTVATDTAIALFDGSTGRLIKNSVVLVSGTGAMTGILSAQIGSGTLLNLTSGQVSSTDNLILTSSGANKDIRLNPSGSGKIAGSYFADGAIPFFSAIGGRTIINQDASQFIYTSGNPTVTIGGSLTDYTVDSATKVVRLLVLNSAPSGDVAAYCNITASDDGGFGPVLDLARSFGTSVLSLTQVDIPGNSLGKLRFIGYGDVPSSGFQSGAEIEVVNAEAITAGAAGSTMYFRVSPIGSNVPVNRLTIDSDGTATFDSDGNIVFNAAGDAIFNADAEMLLNRVFFGSSNEAAISYDGTSLIINPKLSGSANVVVGSSSASGGNDADLKCSRFAIFGSDISSTAGMNCVVTGSLRTALNFILTFNAGTISAPLVVNLIDTSTGNNILSTSTFEFTLNTTSHSLTDATQASVVNISTGINGAINLTSGTNHSFTCLKLVPNGKGVGTGTHSVNLFSTGLFQKKMPTFTSSGTTTYVGAYFGDDVCLENNAKLIFDNTETDSTARLYITKGTTSMSWVSASSVLRTIVGGTTVWNLSTALNKSEIVLGVLAGASTSYGKVGGVLDVNTTAVGNVGGGEDDLITFSVPASALNTNGDSVYFEMSGILAATANTKRIRIKFGATTMVDSTALVINNGKWTAWGRITRTGAATQNFFGELSTDNALLVNLPFEGTAAETLSGAITLKATGESGGSATDDVKQTNNFVRWEPNE